MWVDPGARRGGGGRMLAEAVVAHWRAQGKRGVRFWVAEDNAGARALYALCGFRATGERKAFPGRGSRFLMETGPAGG